ncbi:hypothetical protein [Streptomyces flaveolus]|uniref:hypothetical protein n=1 Tax=Streptomyces flaveolus TaxID=67297 RepID=UPI0036779D75
MSEHQLHDAITDDASLDHPVAHHGGWLAMRYGPGFHGYADNELYNRESSLTHPTLADMAHDSARCARAIRDPASTCPHPARSRRQRPMTRAPTVQPHRSLLLGLRLRERSGP